MFHRLQEGSSLNAAEKRRSIPGNVHQIICELTEHQIFNTEGFLNFKDHRASFEDRCSKIFHQFYHKNITTIKPNEIKQSLNGLVKQRFQTFPLKLSRLLFESRRTWRKIY